MVNSMNNEEIKKILYAVKDHDVIKKYNIVYIMPLTDKYIICIEPKDKKEDVYVADGFYQIFKKDFSIKEYSPLINPKEFKEGLKNIVKNNGENFKMNDILSQSIDNIIDDILSHSGKAHDENPPGRGSGRYPWGSGENPRQGNADKYYKPKLSRKEKKAAIKEAQKKRNEELQLAKNLNDYSKKEAETIVDDDFNRRKELALKYGKPEDIKKFEGFITNEEYQKAFARIEWERKIDQLERSKIDDAFKQIDKIVGYGATIDKALITVNGIYQSGKSSKRNFDEAKKAINDYLEKKK